MLAVKFSEILISLWLDWDVSMKFFHDLYRISFSGNLLSLKTRSGDIRHCACSLGRILMVVSRKSWRVEQYYWILYSVYSSIEVFVTNSGVFEGVVMGHGPLWQKNYHCSKNRESSFAHLFCVSTRGQRKVAPSSWNPKSEIRNWLPNMAKLGNFQCSICCGLGRWVEGSTLTRSGLVHPLLSIDLPLV